MLNVQYYLQTNPDVAAAVARGEITAEAHFYQFGKLENRAPSPFFDPELYAEANPDVAAAVRAGLIPSLYDHFTQHGQDEGRDASYFFDPQVYLAANPDVAAVVASGAVGSAWEHFLEFGQNEVRNTSQFFDMQAYLQANPDVAAAVQAGQTTAFDHFLNNGFQEGRSIGNGISLAQFANDPAAQAAIRSGDIEALMERVAEVAPFLQTYTPPAGYVIPSNQPIPQGFVPVEGEKLVVPPGVDASDDLPDSFDDIPGEEPPVDGGGGTNPDPEPEEPTSDADAFVADLNDSIDYEDMLVAIKSDDGFATLLEGDFFPDGGGREEAVGKGVYEHIMLTGEFISFDEASDVISLHVRMEANKAEFIAESADITSDDYAASLRENVISLHEDRQDVIELFQSELNGMTPNGNPFQGLGIAIRVSELQSEAYTTTLAEIVDYAGDLDAAASDSFWTSFANAYEGLNGEYTGSVVTLIGRLDAAFDDVTSIPQ